MDYVNELLDKAKKISSTATDMALAEKLHLTRTAISNYRHGRALPDAVICAKLSEMTGEPLVKVIGKICEARAITSDEKRVWRRLANIAASLLTSWSLLGLYIMSALKIFTGRFKSCDRMAYEPM